MKTFKASDTGIFLTFEEVRDLWFKVDENGKIIEKVPLQDVPSLFLEHSFSESAYIKPLLIGTVHEFQYFVVLKSKIIGKFVTQSEAEDLRCEYPYGETLIAIYEDGDYWPLHGGGVLDLRPYTYPD